jgi:GNAT superfamily N-acetyltransferase/predicted enzyme related to lactoylglutathione lyase
MPVKFSHPIPQLPVANISETQRHYRDVLGFAIDWTWGENNYGSVSRDEATIFLCASGNPILSATHILHVGDVDAVHSEWRQAGAKLLGEPADMPWGIREFTVEDNNGHFFRISQPSRKFDLPKRKSLAGLRLVHRLPAPAEHQALIEAVGWTNFTNPEAAVASVQQSLFCVVAEFEGALAGMSRVIGDGQQFFYIMDVAVHPDHQGRGIGTALMNEVIAFIQRTAPPKALIGLFTGANRGTFYERFGFKGSETGLYGMCTKELRPAG